MSNTELTTTSIIELAKLIRRRQVSPVEVVAALLKQIERLNPQLNAIVTLAPDALDQAKRAEALVMSSKPLGPLHGVPLTIKDTIATSGIRTTSGSLVRKNYVPTTDAIAVARVKAAGAIILGKTNTPEMAIPYETNNPIFGRTNNPYDRKLTSGGSSGGEAAAIAAGLSPGGIGSDLSGSIRVPAHFCGIVGLKPTSGRIPMTGHTPAAEGPLSNGACLGPMARVVEDVSLLFQVLAESEGDTPVAEDQIKGLRVCWYDFDGVSPVSPATQLALHAAVDVLRQAGLDCYEERPKPVKSGSRLWVDLFSEQSANDLQEFYSGSEDLAGPLARKVLEKARQRSGRRPEDFERAFKERNRQRDELLTFMKSTPVIIAPVGSTGAFLHDTSRVDVDGESVSVFRAFSYCQAFNAFDLPSVVVRAGQTANGLPLAVQIVGKPHSENLILKVAGLVEVALGGWQPPSNTEADPI
jgi:amidase